MKLYGKMNGMASYSFPMCQITPTTTEEMSFGVISNSYDSKITKKFYYLGATIYIQVI